MSRLLILVLALVGVVWWVLHRTGRRAAERRAGPVAQPKAAAPSPQAMVTCARCGVHLPSNESLVDAQGRPYCGEAHRLQGPQQP